VRLEGGTAPVFVLSGSGKVAIFSVFSPDYVAKAEKPHDENFALWKIQPSGGYFAGTSISELGSITYGVVPSGYIQVIPHVGLPSVMREGEKYFYYVETTNAPGDEGYVEIRNSRAIPTFVADPCFGLKDGKSIRVPCPQ